MKITKNILSVLALALVHLISNGQGVITIPTVVHIIWNGSIQNISDNQILNQIDILNADFRRLNADTINTPAPFVQYAGDAKIEFCLAQRDTSGNPTTGITRTQTTKASFADLDSITQTALGGANSWNPMKYLNIWVVPGLQPGGGIGGEIIGYATSPYNLLQNPSQDGIYLRYDFVGDIGAANSTFEGREADHLAGIWLNLYNTFAFDAGGNCRDDSVADTPPVEGASLGCSSFPLNPNDSCGTDSSGEMFMNYMTYSDGSCQNMFTNGQIARMQACLNTIRSGLLTSDGCTPVGINELTNNKNIKVFPDPSSGTFTLHINNLQRMKVEIYNSLGKMIYQESITTSQSEINISNESSGIYFVLVTNGNEKWSHRIIKE